MTNRYNGWTNYATWRVNLEIFDGMEPNDFGRRLDLYDLADCIKEYAREAVSIGANELAQSYALAFLDDVNWREIAQSMIEAYADDSDDSDDITDKDHGVIEHVAWYDTSAELA
jgi:hypothetical protein